MQEQERELEVCNQCGKTFHSGEELRRHQQQEHSAE
jgi:hypothetical protein